MCAAARVYDDPVSSSQESLDLPRAQQARSRVTKQRILLAGTALLKEGGTEALTVAAVSARAGVSVGSVYQRFGDKDRLLAAIQADFVGRVRADMIRRLTPVRAEPGVLVTTAVSALAETYRVHQRLMRVFVVLGQHDEAVLRAGSEASIDVGHVFRQFLDPVVPFIRPPDPEARLDMVYRLVYSACVNRTLHGEWLESRRPLPWRRLAEELGEVAHLYLFGEPPAEA